MNEHAVERDTGDGPRKRVRQACLNCRQKKVRCSGEKPVCGLCRRLAQTCCYEDPPDPPTSPSAMVGNTLATEAMNSKLETLQDRLSSMETTLQGILPLLSFLVNNKQPHSLAPGSTPYTSTIPAPNNEYVSDANGLASDAIRMSKTPSLPPTQTLLVAADHYFRFCYNQPYSLFHEATFRQRLAAGEVPEYLLWAFFGAARRYLGLLQPEPDGLDDAVTYAKIAWERMELPWSPSPADENVLPVLQTIILIVSNEHPAGHCTSAYMKLGFALRLALRTRFHLEPDPNLPPAVKEERRRVFWALYIQDRLISLSRENIPVFRDEQCRVRLPCSEVVFRNCTEERTPELEAVKTDSVDESVIRTCSPLALTVVLASSLGQVTQYILLENRASRPAPPWSPTSPYVAVVSNLMQLETHFGINEPLKDHLDRSCATNGSIDQHVAGPLIYSRALFHLCQCLLHHPFLLKQLINLSQQKAPPSFLSRAWETCRSHAISLNHLNSMRNQNVMLLTSLYGYSTMIAGTIHVLSMHDQNPLVREEAKEHYNHCITFLRELSHFWKHAGLMLARLQRFFHRSTEHSHLVDPRQGESGRSPAELETLWSSVDYALLSIPTRPGSPASEDPARATPVVTGLQNALLDFDFAAWSEAPDANNWDFGDLNGDLGFLGASV